MLENALRAFYKSRTELPKVASSAPQKPATKSYRAQLEEALEKDASLGKSLGNFVSRVGESLNKPWLGFLTLGVAGTAAGSEFLRGHLAERESGRQTERVLAHLKSLYPEDQASKVEEAYAAIAHVAPSVSQNPLIARSIVNNMMKEMARPDFQIKGYPIAPADINTLNTVSKIEESRSKSLSHAGRAQPLLGLIAQRLGETGATLETVQKLVPAPMDEAQAQSIKDRADLDRARILEKEHDLRQRGIIPAKPMDLRAIGG
jgi:hypothetical protein